MDPLTGAALAALVAFASIAAAIWLPLDRWIAPSRLRLAGALALGLMGARALGLGVPALAPLVVLAGGFALGAWATQRERRRAT